MKHRTICKLRALSRSQSGQALVEVALLAPLLLLLLVGAIDFGRFTYDGILLGNGARAGVQFGSQSLGNDTNIAGMESAATADTQTLSGAASPVATTYCQCGVTGAVGATALGSCALPATPACTGVNRRLVYVKVTTSGTFVPWITFPGIPNSIGITRSAVMQVAP